MTSSTHSLVTYELRDGIATITMDDGKVNVLSLRIFSELNAAFDRAEKDQAVVMLTGRTGIFSAGFDLAVLRGGKSDAIEMMLTGFKLAERILSFPTPVVMACTGHALAMGVFLLLAGDYRIGASGPFKIGANEVAIGMTLPYFAIEMCRQRLTPAHFNRAAINAEIFSPEDAVAAGFLDRVAPAPAEELLAEARKVAEQLKSLHPASHTATKLRAREHTLRAVRAAIEQDEKLFRSR